MTKDEADILAIKVVGFEFSEDARRTLALLQALGMLKLDEPKSAEDRFFDRLYGRVPIAACEAFDATLKEMNLKIIEK